MKFTIEQEDGKIHEFVNPMMMALMVAFGVFGVEPPHGCKATMTGKNSFKVNTTHLTTGGPGQAQAYIRLIQHKARELAAGLGPQFNVEISGDSKFINVSYDAPPRRAAKKG
jgi:hypothetical protein